MDLNKTMYRMKESGKIMRRATMRQILLHVASETEGQNGSIYIEECDEGGYVVMRKIDDMHGESIYTLPVFATKEEAEEAMCLLVYDESYAASDEYGRWYGDEDSAIEAYVEWRHGEVTADAVRKAAHEWYTENEELDANMARSVNHETEQIITRYEASGKLSKNDQEAAFLILHATFTPNAEMYELSFAYRNMLTDDNLRKLEEAYRRSM